VELRLCEVRLLDGIFARWLDDEEELVWRKVNGDVAHF
jgi:hypothetical protein